MMRATKICATAVALTIAAVLTGCGGGGETTDSSTEIKMDDVDALDGTISDAIPNPDLLTNPDNIPESQTATPESASGSESAGDTTPAKSSGEPSPAKPATANNAED